MLWAGFRRAVGMTMQLYNKEHPERFWRAMAVFWTVAAAVFLLNLLIGNRSWPSILNAVLFTLTAVQGWRRTFLVSRQHKGG